MAEDIAACSGKVGGVSTTFLEELELIVALMDRGQKDVCCVVGQK